MKRTIVVLSLLSVLSLAGTARAASTTSPEPLSKKQLAHLVATAHTPSEHQRIADYYRAESQSNLEQAMEHAQMAAAFRQNPATNNAKMSRSTVDHCQYLADNLKARAAQAARLADQHEALAKEAGSR